MTNVLLFFMCLQVRYFRNVVWRSLFKFQTLLILIRIEASVTMMKVFNPDTFNVLCKIFIFKNSFWKPKILRPSIKLLPIAYTMPLCFPLHPTLVCKILTSMLSPDSEYNFCFNSITRIACPEFLFYKKFNVENFWHMAICIRLWNPRLNEWSKVK